MEKVSIEIATADVTRWLDAKKISQAQRKKEETEKLISELIDTVCEGILVINDDNSITQYLQFPIGEENPKTKLIHKARISGGAVQAKIREMNIKPMDIDGRFIAHIAVITGETANDIKTLDTTTDLNTAKGIAAFFL